MCDFLFGKNIVHLDKLSRNLQNSPSKTFREIIVIHNLKEVESKEIFEHVWET